MGDLLAAAAAPSRARAPPDSMWGIMNRGKNAGVATPTGATGAGSVSSDYYYQKSGGSSSGSSRPPVVGRSYGLTFPSVHASTSSLNSTDNKRVRFSWEGPGSSNMSTSIESPAPPVPFKPMAPQPPTTTAAASASTTSSIRPSFPSSSSSGASSSVSLVPATRPPAVMDLPSSPDQAVRMQTLERGLALLMEEMSKVRASVHEVEAAAASSRGREAFPLSGAESPPGPSPAIGILVRTVKEMQDRIETLEERARIDKDAIATLIERLRDNASGSSNLRLAVDEMRASLPLLKHQDNDMMLFRREVDHRFGEEASRHNDTQKKIDLLFREVSGVGDSVTNRTMDLTDGLRKLEDQLTTVGERVQQTEAIIFKAQKREADKMGEMSREMATVLEMLRTTREEVQRVEEALAGESTLRRQSGKQFLEVVEQLRGRVGEVAERGTRDLTDAVGQINNRISRIYEDLDNTIKDERAAREMSQRQMERDVAVHVAELEDKLLQLQQGLNEARLKQVHLDDALLAAIARVNSDMQKAAKSEENARVVLAEELKRVASEKISAALDATGRLNRGQYQSIEDLRELLRVEIDSRKNEQKDIRNGVEILARDWMEEFESFRMEFRRTSTALELRIDSSEGDIMKECLEQVSSLEEALAARQSLLESVNETHLARIKALTRVVEDENASVRQAIKAMGTTFTEAIDVVQQGQVDMDNKLDHVATKLHAELKDDRSAVHALKRSLESTARMARQANETLSRPGLIPRLDTLRKLQEQITQVSARAEVQVVLDRVTEYLVAGYQSPTRTDTFSNGDRTIWPHSPERQADIDLIGNITTSVGKKTAPRPVVTGAITGRVDGLEWSSAPTFKPIPLSPVSTPPRSQQLLASTSASTINASTSPTISTIGSQATSTTDTNFNATTSAGPIDATALATSSLTSSSLGRTEPTVTTSATNTITTNNDPTSPGSSVNKTGPVGTEMAVVINNAQPTAAQSAPTPKSVSPANAVNSGTAAGGNSSSNMTTATTTTTTTTSTSITRTPSRSPSPSEPSNSTTKASTKAGFGGRNSQLTFAMIRPSSTTPDKEK